MIGANGFVAVNKEEQEDRTEKVSMNLKIVGPLASAFKSMADAKKINHTDLAEQMIRFCTPLPGATNEQPAKGK